jgi:hypothetical protein
VRDEHGLDMFTVPGVAHLRQLLIYNRPRANAMNPPKAQVRPRS